MVSIIIPTYNEEKSIVKAIKSILCQISKKDEIIVVASGCSDNTIPNIKKIKDKRIKLIIEKERKGKASALNLGIKKAKSDVIIQTDGDVEVSKKAINLLIKHFKDENVGAVSGNPIPLIPKNNLFYDWTMMSYQKIREIRENEIKSGNFNVHLSGYLLAFRKKALKKIPFKKGAVDAEMGRIIKKKGYKLTYEPNAWVYVKAPLNIRDFINQKARVRAGYASMDSGQPRTMRSEIFYLPREILKVPIGRLHKFLFSGIIYTYTWFKGKWLTYSNKSLNEVWKTPKSTK